MINMKSEKTIMLSLAIALTIALVGGLVVIPALEETGLLQQAEAKNTKPKNPNYKGGHQNH
jgi:hypothetical protein